MSDSRALIEQYRLKAHEYCAEDDSWSVQGNMPASPSDLERIETRARSLGMKVLFLKRVQVLYVIQGRLTAQFHQNGDLLVNGAATPEDGIRFLEQLL